MSETTIPDDDQEVATNEVEETPEVETEATDTDGVENEAAADADDHDGEEGGEDDGDDEAVEEIELKVGGDILKVPAGAMPEDVRNRVQSFIDSAETSYTKKFQEVAETRKALEARHQTVEKLASLNDAQQDLYARGVTLKGEIERLEAESLELQRIDLNRLYSQNPEKASQVSRDLERTQAVLNQKRGQFSSTIANLSQTEAEFTRQQEAAKSQMREQGRAVVEKVIPKFNPDPVIDYVVSEYAKIGQSLSKDEAKANWSLNPGYAVMAHKAMLYDQQQAKAKTVGGKAPPPKVTAPVTAPKGKAAAKGAVDPDKMSPDQWLKWRNQQLAKKSA